MSLRIRCSSCGRGKSGTGSLCSDCRASSTEKMVYVTESGDRIEVTTIASPSKPSRSHRHESRSSRTSADRHTGPSYPSIDAAYQAGSAESYRDAGRYLGRDERDVERDIATGYPYAYGRHSRPGHETPGGAYVRPRVHPYADRYEYIDANARYSQTGAYPVNPQLHNVPSSHGGNWQQANGSSHPQASYATGQEASGRRSQANYVYSGTEGPDGEIID